jgi:cytochrome c-type biogenesis protein CcmH
MWMFWILTGLVAAGAAALVIARAGAAAREAARGSEDPALSVYRRQLAELDEAAAAGLLGPEELRAARAEAGRRLLRTADAPSRPERPGGRGSRLAAALVSVAAAALALGGYLVLGAPGLPDQPYARRLATWRQADPATLDPPRMAAVLRDIVRTRPHDPQAYEYLGRAEMAAGDPFAASRSFAEAARLRPGQGALYSAEGEALVQDAAGKVTPDAQAAFRQALRLDPKDSAARYYLARAAISGGDVKGGLAAWTALAADMPADDPRRANLLAEIEHVGRGAAPDAPSSAPPALAQAQAGPASATAAALGAPQAAFIHAMVDRQAAELKANPDDPQGWARLVRSYGVLGDAAAQARALAQARRLFARRPDALAPIEAQARGQGGPTAMPGAG